MTKRIRRKKASLLIALKTDAERQVFAAAFRKEAKGGAAGMEQAWSLLVPAGEMPRIAHQILMQDSPAPFDAVVQFWADSAAAVPALSDEIAAIARRLDAWIDRARSAVLVGEEISITTGHGPVLIVMPLRRLPQLSHAQFMEHWFERHADLGEAVEGVRYRQNHVDSAATDALAQRVGFRFEPMDGLTESYFLSTDEAVGLMSRDDVAVGAIADEKRFIDHSRSQFGFYRTL